MGVSEGERRRNREGVGERESRVVWKGEKQRKEMEMERGFRETGQRDRSEREASLPVKF